MARLYVKRLFEILCLILIIIYFYKALLHFWLIILFLAMYDSFKLLYQTKFRRETWDGYKAIRPATGYPHDDELFLLSLLHKLYSNLVFDICYLFLLRRSLSIKASSITYKTLPWLLLAALTGMGRLGWKMIYLTLINWDTRMRWDNYLMLVLCRDMDSRVIIYYKGEWRVNGLVDKLTQLLKRSWPEANDTACANVAAKVAKECENLKAATYNVRVYRAQFLDKRTLIPHRVTLDLHRDGDKVGYETAAKAAAAKGYCGLKPMIPIFAGPKKPTSLLEESVANFAQKQQEVRVPATRYLLGSLGGYDRLLFREEYRSAVEEAGKAKAAMVAVLKDAGIDSADDVVSSWLADPKFLADWDDYK